LEIVSPRPDHANELLALYRVAVADAPHCRFLPNTEQLAAALMLPPDHMPIWLIAEHERVAVGCAALADLPADDEAPERDAITALVFADPAVGAVLLAACEARAMPVWLDAFPNTHGRCPLPGFNGGWDGLPDCMTSVARLLARAGYAPFFRELHLAGSLEPATTLPHHPPDGFTIVLERSTRANFVQRAYAGEHEAGVCYYNTVAALTKTDASRVGYISGLAVGVEWRRRGLARTLLARSFEHLHAMGCDEVWLTTTSDNWPAQALYLAAGLAIVGSSASYRKLR
jgi:ribosomal protein S18 acetylase RimI-like enzyme